METGEDCVKCPYCEAANALDGEFCGVCYKNLRIPDEVRTAVKAEKILAAAAGPAVRTWARLLLIAGLFIFYTRWLVTPEYFSPLDFVNLAFHEAGHIFLGFFGRFIMTSGGTFFQLLFPAVCLLHFMRRGANLGWQLCLFWLGENLLNISIYAGDAIKQTLPLVGSGDHDWTYLLTELGLIAHTTGVAKTIFLCGSAVIFWSFYLIGRDAVNREPLERGAARRFE